MLIEANEKIYNKRYKILNEIEVGQFGKVLKVKDVNNLKEYALRLIDTKSCYKDENFIDFGKEFLLLKILNSEYILKLHETFNDDYDFCFLFEYYEV